MANETLALTPAECDTIYAALAEGAKRITDGGRVYDLLLRHNVGHLTTPAIALLADKLSQTAARLSTYTRGSGSAVSKRMATVRELVTKVMQNNGEVIAACEPKDDPFSRLLHAVAESFIDLGSAVSTLADECDAINRVANERASSNETC